MARSRIPPEKIIADWRAAYERANGRPAPEALVYISPRYRFRAGDRLGLRHYTTTEIVNMTARLAAAAS